MTPPRKGKSKSETNDLGAASAGDRATGTTAYTLDPRNARRHPEQNLIAVEESLRELGAGRSIVVDNNGVVIGGNAVYEKACELGIPVREIATKGDELLVVRRVDLSTDDPRRKALALADNQISTLAEWDEVVLSELLAEVEEIEFETMGFESLTPEHTGNLPERVSLAERFGIPPFSVLNAREGWWQARKKTWLGLGLQSERGRGNEGDGTKHGLTFSSSAQPPSVYNAKNRHEAKIGRKVSWEEFYAAHPDAAVQSGTSIFDPVLCELVYRWFCPPGGAVLDPLAGGSVRGIVAAKLGRNYTGVDLSERQIQANEDQAKRILVAAEEENSRQVKVSSKWARHCFSCTTKYITEQCHGGCCEGSDKIMVSLLPEEVEIQEGAGFHVVAGMLQPDVATGKCPHKKENGLCGVHDTPMQPFGCIASPFTLNAGRTLIIRNRYNMMKCHGHGEPAYKVFRASLELLFGEEEALRISNHLDSGGGDIVATMAEGVPEALMYLDGLKRGRTASDTATPRWIVGDSLGICDLAPGEYDFLFTCPPYADLEVYSEDPRDISTMEYSDFLATYRQIIEASLSMLKKDRFACVVVGDVRDGNGIYRNFVSDTITAFQDAGAALYNEAILVTQLGSLPIRAGYPFESSRKLGKTHQNVLVFIKGDAKKATKAIGPVEAGDPLGFAEEDNARSGGES